jgi:hypothetical protein
MRRTYVPAFGFIAPNGMLMAVAVNGENIFATGTPAALFQIHGPLRFQAAMSLRMKLPKMASAS